MYIVKEEGDDASCLWFELWNIGWALLYGYRSLLACKWSLFKMVVSRFALNCSWYIFAIIIIDCSSLIFKHQLYAILPNILLALLQSYQSRSFQQGQIAKLGLNAVLALQLELFEEGKRLLWEV